MVELVLRVPGDLVEAASDRLADELDALSVAIEDADAGAEDEQPIYGEPGMPVSAQAWPHSTLRALFDDSTAAETAATSLLADPTLPGVHVQAIDDVANRDWVRLTQSQFDPVPITPGFWIVPSWHDVPPQATRTIRLDPGLAFGTGTHPTTRLCLRWIAQRAAATGGTLGGARVLDYGCGSGILAIAAALHGAAAVDAVDIDPAAVEAARANAAANGVEIVAGLPDTAQGSYDVVVANILATPLKLLAPLLAAHVAPGGFLLLAGLLTRQADELIAAYAPWLPLRPADEEDGWVLLAGTAPPVDRMA